VGLAHLSQLLTKIGPSQAQAQVEENACSGPRKPLPGAPGQRWLLKKSGHPLSQTSVGDYLFEISFPNPLAVPWDAIAGKLYTPFLYGLPAATRKVDSTKGLFL
jgi:hypothetical protein